MPASQKKIGSHKHQSELINEFDQLLGKCIRQFQQLEQGIEWRMLQLASATSKPDIGGFLRLAISELSFRSKLTLFETLLKHQIPSRNEYKESHKDALTKASLENEMKRAIASVKRISKIEQLRNRYVHSYWMAFGQPPEANELIPIYRTKTRASPRKNATEFEDFSSERFCEFLAEVADAELEISQSTGRLLGLLDYDEEKKGNSFAHNLRKAR